MKVLHVINTLAVGGAELHLLTLCRALRAHAVEAVVAFGRDAIGDSRSLRQDYESSGIRTVRVGTERRYDGTFPLRILRALRAERPDLLHSHLPRADLAAAFAGQRAGGLPWVVSVHGRHDDRGTWSGRAWMPLVRRAWWRADRLVAISEAVRRWLVGEQGMAPAQVEVIHYGIDLARFAAGGRGWRQAWGLDGQPVVGSIGRLDPRKGHQHLIRAMVSVRRRVPRAMLLIAGHDPGHHRGALERLVGDLGLHDAVRLVGFQGDVPAFLAALDVFALASDSEGFGQVVVEAMAAGKPTVAIRMGPLTEIVAEGASGVLVDPHDVDGLAEALVRLLDDPEEARRMGGHGRTRAGALFSAETMAGRTLDLYRSVLAARRNG